MSSGARSVVLVVGATGQLGSEVARRLAAEGHRVRALVRNVSRADGLFRPGIEIVFGDMRDPAGLREACRGVEAVVSTANGAIPRPGDRFGRDEIRGYRNLLDACRREGVRRFIYAGAPRAAFDPHVPQIQTKHAVEDLIVRSGVPYTILRLPVFMDVYFPALGSSLARAGEISGTLDRPYWFSRLLTRLAGASLDDHGLAVLPGRKVRHAFIAVADAAAYLARAAVHPFDGNLDLAVAGPENLTWREVAERHGEVLGKRVRCLVLPAWWLRVQHRVVALFSAPAGNLLAFLWAFGTHDVTPDGRIARELFRVDAMTAREFLRRKAALRAKHLSGGRPHGAPVLSAS
jgi:NADH dehydrogenase